MSEEIIFYQFSRAKIEQGDFKHFLELYAFDLLPTGRPLRSMMNRFCFFVEGYDSDLRELYSIPEVRKFYSDFNRAWPYWLYFCNIETENLRTMVLCCLESIQSIKRDGDAKVAVEHNPEEVTDFLSKHYKPMIDLCSRGGVFEHLIEERKAALLAYFGVHPRGF